MARLLDDVRELIGRLPSQKKVGGSVKGGMEGGVFSSSRRGGAVEFLEHREYAPGEDPRRIDWKLYARKEKLFIKDRESEVKVSVYLVIDMSGSMNYGLDQENTKLRRALAIGFALAYYFLKQRNRVYLIPVSGEGAVVKEPIPSFDKFYRLVEEADKWYGDGEDVLPAIYRNVSMMKGPGLAFLFSDFLEEGWKLTGKIVSSLRNMDVLPAIVSVLHPLELDLRFSDRANLVSMENSEKLEIDPYLFRRVFRREAERFFANLRKEVEKRGGFYSGYVIDSEPLSLLVNLVRGQWIF